MKTSLKGIAIILAASVSAVSSAATIVSAAGANAASIQAAVDGFRANLGTLNPNTATSFPTGRREINWDGVGDAFAAPNALPANFFNTNSPRGAVFSTDGTGFQVSALPSTGTPARFGNLNSAYASQFSTFSPARLFTPIGSRFTTVDFFLPGTTTPAATRGFGIVFTDVDVAGAARIQLLSGSTILETINAPVFAGDGGLSFLGVLFDDAIVTSVRIRSGDQALSDGVNENLASTDLIAMDDFIYAEPAPVPEPAAANILALSFALAVAVRRRRKATV